MNSVVIFHGKLLNNQMVNYDNSLTWNIGPAIGMILLHLNIPGLGRTGFGRNIFIAQIYPGIVPIVDG